MTASAKDLVVRPVSGSVANAFVRRHHYSSKVAPNSQAHLGVYWDGRLEGALQYGPSTDRRKMAGLVVGSDGFDQLELNRMVFTEALPRNSESRALAISLRMIRREAPSVRWVVTFADATQCGDGTIYRAAGFALTGIRPNQSIIRLPDGSTIAKLSLHNTPDAPRPELGGRPYFAVTGGRFATALYLAASGGEFLPGYQLRYIKLLCPDARLAVPELPYSRIAELGAGMYRGEAAEA